MRARAMIAPSFDAEKIGALAIDIQEAHAEVEKIHKELDLVRNALGAAETQLKNLQIALTRAVDGSLDMNTLQQRLPESYPVENSR